MDYTKFVYPDTCYIIGGLIMLRSTYAVIYLNAIDHNIRIAREKLSSGVKLLAVIKANAYGHGLCAVGAHLDLNDDVDMFGVALCEEGVLLRNAGIRKPILILGVTDETHFDSVVEYDLIPAVFTEEHIRLLSAAAVRQKKQAKAHLKVDTGMHRIGVCTPIELEAVLDAFERYPGVILDGAFTHFAKSEEDPQFTSEQAFRFEEAVALIHRRGLNPIIHAANSGAILNAAEKYSFDMVRLGISMYGYHPDGVSTAGSGLMPALSLVSHISHLKRIAPGQGVSYGQRFIASRETAVATVPIGYGDGYKRCLSSRSHVLIGGRRCPQIGSICMDQIMVDVTDVSDVRVGDEVILIGSQGNESITADELASLAGTISYEILLSISDRVPRIYPN